MALFSLPAPLRLQIWNRHLALRGRLSTCPGNANLVLDTCNPLDRRHYASTGKVPDPHVDHDDAIPTSGQTIAEAMNPNRRRRNLSKQKSTSPLDHTANPENRQDVDSPQLTIRTQRSLTIRKKVTFDPRPGLRAGSFKCSSPRANLPTAVAKQQSLLPSPTGEVQRVSSGSHVGADAAPSDLQNEQKRLEVPTKEDYPHADPNLFEPRLTTRAIRRACKLHLGLDVPACKISSRKTPKGLFSCTKTLEIPTVITISATGEASGQADAALAASTQLLRELHAKGILHRLTPPPPPPDAAETATFNSIMNPLRGEYHATAPSLFDLGQIAQTMQDAFAKAGVPCKIEGQVQVREDQTVAHELTIELSDERKLTAVGEGRNKRLAKALAWAHMVKRLRDTGMLPVLFPTANEKSQRESVRPGQVSDHETDEEVVILEDLVTVDEKTMRAERDAKAEIYKWAARLGMVPVFQTRVVQKRKPGTRKQTKADYLALVEASVELPELKLKIIRVATTLRTAETAAAIAFKTAAEEQEKAELVQASLKADTRWPLLNVDTTAQFFDFYRSIKKDMYLEVVSEPFTVANDTHNSAQIIINEQKVGRPVVMLKKPIAEQIARLTAAIEIVKAEPQLLEQFAAVVRKDKANKLKEVRPIRTHVRAHAVEMMRNGVVEARRAGLSDVRQSMSLATTILEESTSRRRRTLAEKRREGLSSAILQIKQRRRRSGTPTPGDASATLPMSEHHTYVLNMVKSNLYSIIVGATGSGKTTQVPQIILDDAVDRREGGFCDIICTQPRRLAAISVASRVAAERHQPVGKKVGYHVRFDAKLPPPGGSITYCTTGVLLEQLKHDAEGVFDSVSHIVIDEVHERSLPIDFLMVLLKRTIRDRQAAGKSVPKVILMSATHDPDLFARYFATEQLGSRLPAPVLKVPGRMFPVQEKYLEDLVADFSASERAALGAMAGLDKGMTTDYLESELSFARGAQRTAPVIDWKNEAKVDESEEDQAAAREKEEARVPLVLMAASIAHICQKNDKGAILAFLPGISEILAVRDLLYQSTTFGLAFDDPSRFKILALHSGVPPHEQNEILEPVPQGCRKIILSTTIAETSVTVPDVKYVVDSGKLRQNRYDQVRRINQLVTTWGSSSNVRQRAGRAGRVQAGHYYALFTRQRRQAMPASEPPELHRSDLQEVCLSIKAQGFSDSVQSFLSEAIEPPQSDAVLGAIDDLKAIEALTHDESLTTLGKTLSKLPVHPSLGKMILLGIVFRCLDPMVSLSSMDRDRSLFVLPQGERARVKTILQRYNQHGSDQLAVYEAFKEVRSLRDRIGLSAAEQHARANFIHWGCFKSAAATAESIEKILIQSHLVPDSSTASREQSQYGGAALNRHSDNPALIKALFLAGVRPNLAAKNSEWPLYRTHSEQRNLIHPGSLNHVNPKKTAKEGDKLLAYESLRKTIDGATTFVKDITEVTPMRALLFGGNLKAEGTRVTMDEWLPFKIENLEDAVFATRLVLEFRKALDRMLNGAFNSLSESKEGLTIADDPIRDGFVKATVAVLEYSEQRKESEKRDSGIWVPPEWKKQVEKDVEKTTE